jgi:hypothetical protein
VRKWWTTLAILVVVLAGLGLAQTSPGHVLLRDAGLFQVPPRYTELAFSSPQDLPTRLDSRHAAIPVSFDIHNASGARRRYSWSIELVRYGRRTLKAQGVISVPAQGGKTVARVVRTSCRGGRVQIVARLANPAESVDLWLTCVPASGGAR